MPGLVDTHIHAPQYLFAGTRVDLPLLQWLTTYTFPTEAKYKDNDFAEEVYTRVVRRTLKNGTTTACYFATIYTDTSLLLADIIDKFGQRAFVGKVCMDMNDAVPHYKETTADSSVPESLSHISETEEELKVVENMFPAYQNYTDLYDKNKLLTSKTVMAHACHLSEEELQLFNLRGAAVAHCPSSNFSCFSHSTLNPIVRSLLWTDSLFSLSALGLDDVIGNFEVGKEFDALLINTKASDSPFDLFSADTFEYLRGCSSNKNCVNCPADVCNSAQEVQRCF
uniref:Guanine deaminase n=1 Tax=Pavo cristatus TaxID=9049 RepID=A0A8C9F5U2_PAVCR